MTQKELNAYQAGYNLGWFRALETVKGDLEKIAEGMMESATFRQIEEECRKGEKDPPLFLALIMGALSDIGQMKAEQMPILAANRHLVNYLGTALEQQMILESKKMAEKLKGGNEIN